MQIVVENIYSRVGGKDYYPLEGPRNKLQLLIQSQYENFSFSLYE
jgi:hypothetical protein